MRTPAGFVVLGLLAWLPACRSPAFESCRDESETGCAASASTGGMTPPPEASSGDTDLPRPTPPTTPPKPPASSSSPDIAASSAPNVPPAGELDAGVDAPSTHEPSSADASEPEDTSEAAATSGADVASRPDTPPMYTYGQSLIENGDFSAGDDHWNIERVNGAFSDDFSDDELCVRALSNTSVIIGWPKDAKDSLTLPAGRYQFSFRARGRGAHVWAKVGHAYEPYTVLFEREWAAEKSGWHDLVYEFDFAGDDAVGVAFNVDLKLGADRICLDDVALRLAEVANAR